MNRKQLCFSKFQIPSVIVILFLLGRAASAIAGDKDCWADFYEDAQYKGKHIQLAGPTELTNLNDVNGENWDLRIGSLKVGPKAMVTVFDNIGFRLTVTNMAKSPGLMRSWGITEKDIKEADELIFRPNAMIHDLSDFNFHQKVRSLKIKCQ